MKRPVTIAGFAYAISLATASFLGAKVCIWLCTLFFALFALTLLIKPLRKNFIYPFVCIVCALGFGVYSAVTVLSAVPAVNSLSEKECEMSAVITDINVNGNTYSYEVKADITDDKRKKYNLNLILYSYFDLYADYYDEIECTALLSVPNSEIQGYYNSRSIYLCANLEKLHSITAPESKGIMYQVLKLRDSVVSSFYTLLPQRQASLLSAVVIGEKSLLSDEALNGFKKLSVYHLIVVSGLHTSIIGLFIFKLCKLIFRKKKLSALISTLFLIIFSLTAGLSASVIRAGIMTLILIWASSLREQTDTLTTLGIAALAILIPNPLAAGNYGFMLTFLNVTAIVLWASKLSRYIMRRLDIKGKFYKPVDFIVSSTCASLCASFGILPFTVLVFKSISPYLLISNLLLIPATELLVLFGMTSVVLSLLGSISFLAKPLALVCGIIANFMLNTVEFISSLPYSTVYLSAKHYVLWLGICLIMVGIGFIFTKTLKGKLVISVLCALALIASNVTNSLILRDKLIIEFMDTVDGTSAYMRKNDKLAVFCLGGKGYKNESVLSSLHSVSDEISLLVVTSDDEYACDIFDEFKINTTILHDVDKLDEEIIRESKSSKEVIFDEESRKIELWDDVTIEITDCDKGIWIYITTDFTSVLIAPKKSNVSDLDENHRNAEYVVLSSLPENMGLIDAENVIVSSNDFEYDILPQDLKNRCTTTANGDIILSKGH